MLTDVTEVISMTNTSIKKANGDRHFRFPQVGIQMNTMTVVEMPRTPPRQIIRNAPTPGAPRKKTTRVIRPVMAYPRVCLFPGPIPPLPVIHAPLPPPVFRAAVVPSPDRGSS